MPDAKEYPERRKDHALRALYGRVETLEKISSDQDKTITLLERETVTYKALSATVIVIALALFGGAWKFSESVKSSAESAVGAQAAVVTAQGQKLDTFIDKQASTNIKTEALYLLSVERRPREEVRAVVLQTAKEK